jgi:Uma2 family endonuclease
MSRDDGPITVEEYLALPEDRWRFELIAGRLVLRPQADLGSATIASGVAESIRLWAAGADSGGTTLAETGFVVSASGEELDTIYVPALAYVRDRCPEASDDAAGTGSVRLVPDLVVEIASPAQQREELAERANGWLGAGVRLVWIIWPARRQVDVWRLEGDGAEVGTPVVTPYAIHQTLQELAELPGYSYPVAHLFY